MHSIGKRVKTFSHLSILFCQNLCSKNNAERRRGIADRRLDDLCCYEEPENLIDIIKSKRVRVNMMLKRRLRKIETVLLRGLRDAKDTHNCLKKSIIGERNSRSDIGSDTNYLKIVL